MLCYVLKKNSQIETHGNLLLHWQPNKTKKKKTTKNSNNKPKPLNESIHQTTTGSWHPVPSLHGK